FLPLMVGAAIVQVVIFTSIAGRTDFVHEHGASIYVMTLLATLVFLAMNVHIPGIPIIALGALLNALVISANGGYMPAPEEALIESGRHENVVQDEGGERLIHTNSTIADDDASLVFDSETPLLILGDIIAIPDQVPLANVISIGDILIALGAMVTIVRVMHLTPRHRRSVKAGKTERSPG
ncbi:MAG: DUF5317 domain-containing protein, partial [Chloroflexota bacterium]